MTQPDVAGSTYPRWQDRLTLAGEIVTAMQPKARKGKPTATTAKPPAEITRHARSIIDSLWSQVDLKDKVRMLAKVAERLDEADDTAPAVDSLAA